MSNGNIVEIIGAVVDVEFPRESVPRVYDALSVSETGLTLEVQQQLGDGVVRTIAMGSSDGLNVESKSLTRELRSQCLWVKQLWAVFSTY